MPRRRASSRRSRWASCRDCPRPTRWTGSSRRRSSSAWRGSSRSSATGAWCALSGERAARREAHWRRVAIAACEQSGPQPHSRSAAHAGFPELDRRAGRRRRAGCSRRARRRSPAQRRPNAALELADRSRGRVFRARAGPRALAGRRSRWRWVRACCAPRRRRSRRSRRSTRCGATSADRIAHHGEEPEAQDRSLREVVSHRHALHPPVGRGDVRDRIRRRGARRTASSSSSRTTSTCW